MAGYLAEEVGKLVDLKSFGFPAIHVRRGLNGRKKALILCGFGRKSTPKSFQVGSRCYEEPSIS